MYLRRIKYDVVRGDGAGYKTTGYCSSGARTSETLNIGGDRDETLDRDIRAYQNTLRSGQRTL